METFPIPAPAFKGDSRTVDAGNAFAWLRQGWVLFIAQPGQWLLLTIVFVAMMLALSIVPMIGALAANLLTPVFVAGLLHAGRKASNSEKLELADLYAGFGKNAGNLVILGLIYMFGMFLIFVITM